MFEVLFLLVLIGCGVSSYALGRKSGIVATVGYLIDEEILGINDDQDAAQNKLAEQEETAEERAIQEEAESSYSIMEGA